MDSSKADSLVEALQAETEDHSNLRLSKVEKVPSKKSCKMTPSSVVLKTISTQQPSSAQHKSQKKPQNYKIDPTFLPCLTALLISSFFFVYGMVSYEEMDSSRGVGDFAMMMAISLMELVVLIIMRFKMDDKKIWEGALTNRLAWSLISSILCLILDFGRFGTVFLVNWLITVILWWAIIVSPYTDNTDSRPTSVSRQHDGYGAIDNLDLAKTP